MTANEITTPPVIARAMLSSLLGLALIVGATGPAWAVPKGTSTTQYCGCTCATNAGNGLLYWEKVGQCGLAGGKACKWKNGAGTVGTGTLHSCIDCTRDQSGSFTCLNQSLAPPSSGKFEQQITPRGIEDPQELTPPPVTDPEEKSK